MATAAENIQAAINSLAEEIANEQARRTALTAAGEPAPVTYSAGGRSFSYTGWLAEKTKEMQNLMDTLNALSIPESSVVGY